MIIKIAVPLVLMLVIMFCKKIPYIGGKTSVALAAAGMAALLLGEIYNPIDWFLAWFDGTDRIAWIIGLSLLGSIYAATQTQVGALETVLNILRAKFGNSPKGLVVVILITLSIAGSLLGDTYAAATVVGVLTIGAMADLGLKGELITAIIAIGASMGSIMPPITQSVFMSASMLNIDPSWATQPAYITVGIGIVLVCIFIAKFYLKDVEKMPEELRVTTPVSQIFREKWKTLIPLFALIFCIICRSLPNGCADFMTAGLNLISVNGTPFLTWLAGVPILKMFSNTILLSIIIATFVAFAFKEMRGNVKKCFVDGVTTVKSSVITQLCLGLMLGGFYAGGTISAIQELAQGLNSNALILGGAAALLIIGMLTGTQSAPQSAIFSFLGPTLVSMGYCPVNVAIFGSHIASAGQAMLPANLLVVVVASMVGSQIHEEVKPIKAMIYCLPCGIYLLIAGLTMIYMPAWPF